MKSPEVGEIYLRKSRALGDPDDPGLLAHHRAALLRLAEQDGVHIPPENIIQEVGSSETINGRPKFAAKVAEWEAGQARARVIYVTELERLSRASLQEAGRIMEALRGAGVKVRTFGRTYDLAGSDDEFFYALGSILSRRELQKYKERVEWRRQEQVRQGMIRTGKPPWGYVWDRNGPGRGVLRPHPDRFPLLVAICREVIFTSIRQLAVRYGVPASTLDWTLANPAICGYPARRFRATLPGAVRTPRPLPRALWVWPEQPGDYPAACTRAEWEQIQAVIEARQTRRQKTGFDEHGWARDVLTFVGRPGPVRLASMSPRHLLYEQVTPGAPRCHVRREAVHAVVYAALRRVLTDPEALSVAFARRAEPEAGAGAAALVNERQRLRDALERLTEERAMLTDEEGRHASLRVQQRLEQELRRLNEALARAAREREAPADDGLAPALLARLAESFPVVWEQLTGPEKRALVNALIRSVPVQVEKPAGSRLFVREFLPVVYQPWVPVPHGE